MNNITLNNLFIIKIYLKILIKKIYILNINFNKFYIKYY